MHALRRCTSSSLGASQGGRCTWTPRCMFSSASALTDILVPLSKRGAKAVAAELRSLRRDADARQQARQMVIFGRTLVEEYVTRGGRWQHVFQAPSCQLRLGGRGPQTALPPPVTLGHAELVHAAGVECAAPDACACVLPLPTLQPPPLSCPRVLVLDALADPGNLGSVIRSALAFDFALVLLGPGACDPFNEKVVRSSMGACVDARMYACEEAELRSLIEQQRKAHPNLQVLVSDVATAGCVPLPAVRLPAAADAPVWLVVGNEAHGVRASLRSLGSRVHVPMSPRVESLNAAVAAAILMQHVHAQHSTTEAANT